MYKAEKVENVKKAQNVNYINVKQGIMENVNDIKLKCN